MNFVITETKDQFARDDPAFLVLLSIFLLGICHIRLNLDSNQTKLFCSKYYHNIILLSLISFTVSSAGFGLVLRLSFIQTFFLFIYIVVVDCILVGITIATLVWYVTLRIYFCLAARISYIIYVLYIYIHYIIDPILVFCIKLNP